MPSHSSHATAVTTSNIPVGKCCTCSHKSLCGISSAYDQAFMSEVVGLFSYYWFSKQLWIWFLLFLVCVCVFNICAYQLMFWRQCLSLTLELTNEARLVGQYTPREFACLLTFRCWGCRHTVSATPSFLHGFWGSKLRSSCFTASPHQLNCSQPPELDFYFFILTDFIEITDYRLALPFLQCHNQFSLLLHHLLSYNNFFVLKLQLHNFFLPFPASSLSRALPLLPLKFMTPPGYSGACL